MFILDIVTSPHHSQCRRCEINAVREQGGRGGEGGPSTGQPVFNETSDKFTFPLCLLRKARRKRIMLLRRVRDRIMIQSRREGEKRSRLLLWNVLLLGAYSAQYFLMQRNENRSFCFVCMLNHKWLSLSISCLQAGRQADRQLGTTYLQWSVSKLSWFFSLCATIEIISLHFFLCLYYITDCWLGLTPWGHFFLWPLNQPWWSNNIESRPVSAALYPTASARQWSLTARLVWCLLGQCEDSSGGTWWRVFWYTPIHAHTHAHMHWCKQRVRQKRPCCLTRDSSAGAWRRSDPWPHDPDLTGPYYGHL